MTTKPKPSISELLRDTIADSEIPLLTIEQATGVKRQSIMRFLRRERSLRLDIADKLASYFQLELKSSSRRKAK
jgi:plasmid maintenance system antidote protein VapI